MPEGEGRAGERGLGQVRLSELHRVLQPASAQGQGGAVRLRRRRLRGASFKVDDGAAREAAPPPRGGREVHRRGRRARLGRGRGERGRGGGRARVEEGGPQGTVRVPGPAQDARGHGPLGRGRQHGRAELPGRHRAHGPRGRRGLRPPGEGQPEGPPRAVREAVPHQAPRVLVKKKS